MAASLRKIILTTGGTGGHIFPALAVAEEMRRSFPAVEILFIGGEKGQEERLARQAGLDFMSLPVRGFFGRGFKAVAAAFRLLRGICMARGRIRKFKPDLVIGFGGYAAAAGVVAGFSLGLPTMIHEQNSVPGIANRLLGRMVNRVCLSLPAAEDWFKAGKTVLTGNPVRESIRKLSRREAETEIRGHLLVLGGSQGARALNTAVLEDLPLLLEKGLRVRIQAGAQDIERVSAALEKFPPDAARANAFIDDMEEAYAWADLVVCRAGATTVAELAVAGRPALFVPFPFATHNHQLHNAQEVEKAGAARVLEQKDLQPRLLGLAVLELFSRPDKLRDMARAARRLANPVAAENVVKEALKVLDAVKK